MTSPWLLFGLSPALKNYPKTWELNTWVTWVTRSWVRARAARHHRDQETRPGIPKRFRHGKTPGAVWLGFRIRIQLSLGLLLESKSFTQFLGGRSPWLFKHRHLDSLGCPRLRHSQSGQTCWKRDIINGRSPGSWNGGTLVPYKAIFWGDIPLHSPKK